MIQSGKVFVFTLLMVGLVSLSYATGLKTNYSKVAIKNLPIGHSVSMKKIANAPVMIGSNYNQPIFVEIIPVKPQKTYEDFEPIPDAAWVTLESRGVTLAANGKVKIDLILNIPNDTELLGKHYQCNLLILTKGVPAKKGMQFGFTITGKLLFTIAPVLDETAYSRAINSTSDADFELIPPVLSVFNVTSGSTVEVKTEQNKRIILKNESEKRQRYFLNCIKWEDTDVIPKNGSQINYSVDSVDIKDDEMVLRGGTQKELDIKINVPKEVEFSNGPLAYLFLVSNGPSERVRKYIKVFLWGGEPRKSFEIIN